MDAEVARMLAQAQTAHRMAQLRKEHGAKRLADRQSSSVDSELEQRRRDARFASVVRSPRRQRYI